MSNVRCFSFPRGVSLSWLCRPDGEWSPRQVYCTVQHCTLYTVHCTADTTLDSIHCILLHWDYTGQCEWLLRYAGAAVRGEQTWISLYWLSTSHFANIKLRIKVKRLPLSSSSSLVLAYFIHNSVDATNAILQLISSIQQADICCHQLAAYQTHQATILPVQKHWWMWRWLVCCVLRGAPAHVTSSRKRCYSSRPAVHDEGGGMHSNVSWSRNYLLCHLRRPLSPSIDLSQLLD